VALAFGADMARQAVTPADLPATLLHLHTFYTVVSFCFRALFLLLLACLLFASCLGTTTVLGILSVGHSVFNGRLVVITRA
jgi:hypothetical protein